MFGDVLDDRELHFVEAAQTFECAMQRIEVPAESMPRQFVNYNEETGQRVFIMRVSKGDATGSVR